MNRTLLLIVLIVSTAATALAQSSGLITGRVTDANTGLALSGVRVSLRGNAAETYTGPGGTYSLSGVSSGEQTVTFSYVGYSDLQANTVVAPGGAARLDAEFSAVQMDAMVIEGALVGTARAINEQRAAATLKNIVAADEIGRFPDQNAAEALQRIPGVSLYRDQGEGRYIVLRGLNYTFTSVKVDGGSFAGADLGDRATALDVVPADALDSIEVTKVPTPDMDGEGLGGQVNIKTKSPFDNDGIAAGFSAQGQYSALEGGYSSKFNGFVSNRFGSDGQHGFIISPTWQVREFGSHNFETGGAWVSPDDNDTPFYVAEALEFRDYEIERERYGVSLAFETRPDDLTSLYLKAGYNNFTDTESRHLTIFDFTEGTLDEASVTATSATHTGLRRYGRRLRIREKDQDVLSLVAGGEKRFGSWTVDAQAGFTEGKEKRPDELTARFRRNTRDAVIRYDAPSPYELTVTQLAGASFMDPASYAFQRVDLANESGSETSYDLGFNARHDFSGDRPAFVKFGASFRAKEKESEGEVYEFDRAPATFTFANLVEPASDYPYLRVPRISTAAVQAAYYANPSAFTGERVFEDSEFEDFSINEDVLAAYVMGGVTVGRLNALAGLRVERTEFDTTGRELDLVNETARDISAGQSYTNWLPGVHLRFDATRNLVYRASFSTALARPSFGDSAFRSNVNSDDLEITVGNPNLKALEATNWDVSVEYYLPSLGVVSAAAFYKDVKNFSYEFEEAQPRIINGDSYEVTTFANGSSGSIKGLELAWQQQLRFLPAPLDGFGALANLTLLDSDASYPTRPGERVPFIGQSDYTGNVGLTYEKGRVFARLALNFRSERLREDEAIGGSANEDLWVDDHKQLDLTVRYDVSDRIELFSEVLNLTGEPFRVYLNSDNGQGKRLGQVEAYDWSANFGVRWKL